MKKINQAHRSRREFLKRIALMSLGGASGLSTWGSLQRVYANAATDPASDYKALVCVFLLGGNDAFNMLVPRSQSEYNSYAASRQSLAIAREALLPISPLNGNGVDYGLHPNLGSIKTLFDQGQLSFVGNLGALVEPVTQSDIVSGRAVLPPQLFSHNDQQNYIMSLQATKPQQGWASRVADMMLDMNSNPSLSTNITLTGANTWQGGGTVPPYSLSAAGVPTLFGLDLASSDDFEVARSQLFQQLLGQQHNHIFTGEFARVQSRAMDLGSQVSGALDQAIPLTTVFNSGSRLASSLQTIARLISQRQALGMNRQIFFVGVGDYDTHGDQARRHPLLMSELSESLASFYEATVELGIANQVTTFTASDFGRTLTSNGDGTDHGWGGHQIVMGGAVNGGDIYGTMPDLAIGGADDFGEGRIIPTTSMDQYSATMASWFGLGSEQIDEAFPNLANFNIRDLGFLRS